MAIGKSPRASRRRLAIVGESSLPSKGISTATSSNSQCAGPGEGRMARAPSTSVLSSAGAAGLQVRGATGDIRVSAQGQNINGALIAGPTASGESALAPALAQKGGGGCTNTPSLQA